MDNGVDDNNCVLTSCTLSRRGYTVQDVQRWRVRWLVVDNASAAICSAVLHCFPALYGIALDTCHLPMKYEAVASNRKSPGSQVLRRLVSKFKRSCLWVHPPDLCIPFNGDVTRQMDEREQYFYTHLCKSSLPHEQMDLATADMRSARAWTDFACWIRALAAVATMFPNEMRNKNSLKRKSRLRIPIAAATFVRFEWYMNNARIRTTLSARESALMGSGTCGNEAERRGVFNVALPTFRVKLDIFHLSQLISVDAARRTPMLRQVSQGRVRGGRTQHVIQLFCVQRVMNLPTKVRFLRESWVDL